MPNINGDGRAQCVADDTVYADNGDVYPVPSPNEVSTPSPDYAGQTFTYYSVGSYVRDDGTCPTEPGPNGGSTGSSTSTATSVLPTGTGSGSYPTGTVAGFPTGTAVSSGSGYPGSGTNSTGANTPYTPTPVAFTGVANEKALDVGMLVIVSGAVLVMAL